MTPEQIAEARRHADALTQLSKCQTNEARQRNLETASSIITSLADAIVAERARCVTIAQKGRRKVDVAAGYQAALAVDEHIIEPIERGEQPLYPGE